MNYFLDTEFLEDGTTIELISIGIVAADGREFYAEVDLPQETWERVYAHEWLVDNVVPGLDGMVSSRQDIADDIQRFVTGKPSFWGWCSAYDWVVLNQLYGSMVDHPTKWQFWCNDLAQYAEKLGVRRSLPAQEGTEHNALDDARWNKVVYDYLVETERNN